MLDFALADDRLLNSPDGRSTGHGGHFDNYFHAHFVIGMHARSNIDVDANLEILELSINQGVDAGGTHADSRLKAAGCHRHLIPDAKFGGLPINGSNLWVLDNLRVSIG